MRYRVKHDFLWFKKGEIIKTEEGIYSKFLFLRRVGLSDCEVAFYPSEYPNDFEPIDEEEEKDLEAKKRLEERGYVVRKNEFDLQKTITNLPIPMCRHNFTYGALKEYYSEILNRINQDDI